MVVQFIGSALVGGMATGCHYLVLWACLQHGLSPVPASGLGMLIGAVIVYFLNFHFTFNSTRSHREAVKRFLIMVLLGLVVNTVVLQITLVALVLSLPVAQLIATGVQFLVNFYMSKNWVFKGVL